jgi:hypothetical protein
MNTTHVEHDALAALRAELTIAAGRRIRRRRSLRRTAVLAALIALLLAATAATAALTKFSTGVPAVDELLDVEHPSGGGPVSASRRLIVPEGDHRTNVVAYLTNKGSVCITTADFHRGGARGSSGGCPPLGDVKRRVERHAGMWFSGAIGADERTWNLLIDGAVRSIRTMARGDWIFAMTPPWTPRVRDGRPFRLVVAIDRSNIDVGNDGVQMGEFPRWAYRRPNLRLTYRDGRTRILRGR